MSPEYEALKNLILKHPPIAIVHRNVYKKYLESEDEQDQIDYIETVISQTEDSKNTATGIGGLS